MGADSRTFMVTPARVAEILVALSGQLVSRVGRVTKLENLNTTADGATAVLTIESRTAYPEEV
nr:hypothetical protein DA06_24960 [Georgenia sp. SUBG003]